MKVTVISGTPTVNGALLSPGYSNIFYSPLYALPITFESDSSFTLKILPAPSNFITFEERRYYFPKNTPEGFNKVANGVYHSPIIKGGSVPGPVQRFIDRCVKKPTSIIICGEKSSGKSTLSRYIANRAINVHGKCAYLNLDPGQPEFSLPGILGLTLLDDFILEPPEIHDVAHSQQMILYGSNSPSDNLDMFYECLDFLLKNVPQDYVLVINSFGWLHDLGFTIHQEIIKKINPQQTIVIHKPDQTPPKINEKIFRYELQPRAGLFSISPIAHRELRIYSYFKRNKSFITLQDPIEKPFNSVRIGFVPNLARTVDPRECLTALCGSLVALLDDQNEYPRPRGKVQILKNIPICECVGIGLVRAIDKQKGIFYIITPEKDISFNTIVLTNIPAPKELFNDTTTSHPNYLGVGILNREGASTDPLVLKKSTALD